MQEIEEETMAEEGKSISILCLLSFSSSTFRKCSSPTLCITRQIQRGSPHCLLVLLVVSLCAKMAQAACSKDAQIQILRPTSGDVVFDPAPELELSAVVRDDETDEDSHQIRVMLDGSYLIQLPVSAGQVQLSGLKNGLHHIHVQVQRSICDLQLGLIHAR